MSLRKPLLLLLALTLLLTACSRAGLAYRNLDWLIPWKLDDYVTLTSEQSAWLKPRLQQHLAWHCSVELPRYLDWLQTSQTLLAQPDEQDLSVHLDEFADALQRLAVEVTPSTTELLRGLSPRQVEELFENLQQQNTKLHEEFAAPSAEEQVAYRAQRMEERLQPWFGKLSAQQSARVTQWAQSLGGDNQVWLDNRKAWQAALRQALEVRRGDQFDARIRALLQDREQFYTEAYQARFAMTREAMSELLGDLIAQADDGQRERARKRLASLHSDLAAQQCSTEAVAAR